jgi:hypothetical protein
MADSVLGQLAARRKFDFFLQHLRHSTARPQIAEAADGF